MSHESGFTDAADVDENVSFGDAYGAIFRFNKKRREMKERATSEIYEVEEETALTKCCKCLSCPFFGDGSLDKKKFKDFSSMNAEAKSLRVAYLWSRVKIYLHMIRFINQLRIMQKESAASEARQAEVILEEDLDVKDDAICSDNVRNTIKIVWMHLMSVVHNFNLYSTPILLLWPDTLP